MYSLPILSTPPAHDDGLPLTRRFPSRQGLWVTRRAEGSGCSAMRTCSMTRRIALSGCTWVNRPGSGGGSDSTESWSRASTEEVSGWSRPRVMPGRVPSLTRRLPGSGSSTRGQGTHEGQGDSAGGCGLLRAVHWFNHTRLPGALGYVPPVGVRAATDAQRGVDQQHLEVAPTAGSRAASRSRL